ncbi:DNA topoisomerase IV subunit A [Frondihabitans sp. 4ASC-45]|uniref:DNA gyrase/topoisomerase IV subunit A n=1 Tax=Frondihabitans sp. 4ASC-45 TaxID=3111636 RepID=UPI003C13AE7F
MTTTDSTGSSPTGERIEEIDVSSEMQGSFLEYAYSVIYSRALPDARDGLKPVQRRILYMMSEMGLRPERGHVKSARVTGEVMGKLHPHGDSAIYDALVRLAQDFTMRLPTIDGHGNFGSLDDPPAAARYTEVRLAPAAMAMNEGLGEDVVDFVPNYDNQLMQPEVLPAAFPNLLVNGGSGIAVGMATNMAPHNLVEVIGAARHLIEHPEATLDDLMAFVPGPDLPTGGTIAGLAGVRDAYATGRGSFKVRAKVSIENLTARKKGLVFTELPYMIGPEKIIEKVKDGVNAKKLTGISDINDFSDRHHGMRLIIDIKTGFSPEAVLEQLYRHTPLEDGFSINNVALVEGQPRTLGLKELLEVYVAHRLEVVTRRSRYRLQKREDRLHLVEGLLIAILDIDEVIQVIRTSDDSEAAKTRLREVFDLSDLQAEYILELRLRRLTKFSRMELEAERDELLAAIASLRELLSDPAKLRALVSSELADIADEYGTPRRTLLTEAAPSVASTRKNAPVVEVADLPTRVYLSTTGRLLRVDLQDPAAADTESGAGPVPPSRRTKHDAIRSSVTTTTRAEIGAVTSTGRLIRFSPVDLPAAPPTSVQLGAGVPVKDYLGLSSASSPASEKVLALVSLDSADPVALGTAQGVVKRVTPGAWPSKPEFPVIALKPGDSVVGVAQGPDSDELVFVTTSTQLLRYPAALVRPQGTAGGGVAGISLAARATVLFFGAVPATASAVVATISTSAATIAGADPGRAKISDFADYPAKGRATGGVRAHALLKGEDGLSVAWVGVAPAIAVAADGGVRKLPETLVRRDASGTPLDTVVGSIGGAVS